MIALDYGIPTDKEGLQLRLGVERGFFRDEGIDLEIRIVFGGPEIAAAYDSGALKVGELGTPPGITAISRGARFRIIGSGVRRHAVQYLVASPAIRDWADLRGKTAAALTIGSCSYWFMRLVLQKHGIDPDADLNVIGLGSRYPRLLELFEQGELQAAVISEPNVSIGEARGLFRILQALTDEDYCPTMQWSIVVANRQTIGDEPELLSAVLRASQRSYHYCFGHPDEWAAFGARWFGTDRPTMAKSIERELRYLHGDCDLNADHVQLAIDLQLQLGAIKAPLAAADLIVPDFAPASIAAA
jgi:ABC-type nitrate/sulfonate/bicarbonate transport system substrate-binding protein